jgi:DNA repair protein RecN (Recombination protein N)
MLLRLQIQDFALIDALDLDLRSGLTAMTGETGSGKSIVLGALGLALGDRADLSAVRNGAEKCIIEAWFTASEKTDAALSLLGLDVREEGLLIRRELTASGRSRAFVNDTPVKVQDLKQLGLQLVDLHGQDETRAIVSRATRLGILDRFGGHTLELARYAEAFEHWTLLRSQLSSLQKRALVPQADTDYLRFQLSEIENLDLEAWDVEAMESEHSRLTHAQVIRESLGNAVSEFDSDDFRGASTGALTSLRSAAKHLASAAEAWPNLKELGDRVTSLEIEAQDLHRELQLSLSLAEENPERLAFIDGQLDGLRSLLFKHRVEGARQILALAVELREQLDASEQLGESLVLAQAACSTAESELALAGETLKKAREIAGENFCQALKRPLASMKLQDSNLSFSFPSFSAWDELGTTDVAMYFCANLGGKAWPLEQVASGGERSRLMLAIKSILGTVQSAPTIILDEIDTGVSGEVAARMAALMASMSQEQQVIAVTHLPQVAAKASHHLEVNKSIADDISRTDVQYIEGKERVEALAEMLSGTETTDAARQHAKDLLTG